ncbi:Mbeg1-like protein [Anaerosporobacter sp.]
MSEKLSKEQLLLLNNLMYMKENDPLKSIVKCKGKTVAEIMESIETSELINDKGYDAFVTGIDWKKIIRTIKSDEQLMRMEIVTTYVDKEAGGGISAVFIDPTTKEAVVAFRGTSADEWKDNFVAGGKTDASDGVSTECQESALKWYRSLDLEEYYVTITGHSKGGNKSKYITIRDNTVDRCVAYDGQGFSDEFMEKYKKEIMYNQDKIENHNVDTDYVNILLNDIGTKKYYKGYDYGEGGFAESHGPSTFFYYKSNLLKTRYYRWIIGDKEYKEYNNAYIKAYINESPQDPNMIAVDEFLNSYLRTLPSEDKQKTLEMIGELVEEGFKGTSLDQLLDIILRDDNVDSIANLTAYLLKYQQVNPELIDALKEVLNKSGLSNVSDLVDTVVYVTNGIFLDLSMTAVSDVAIHLSNPFDPTLSLITAIINNKTGCTLSRREMTKLLSVILMVTKDLKRVEVNNNGEDIQIKTLPLTEILGDTDFAVKASTLQEAESKMTDYSRQLKQMSEDLEEIAKNIDSGMIRPSLLIRGANILLKTHSNNFTQMGEVLKNIRTNYVKSEQRIYDKVV